MMMNPTLMELVGRERINDLHREAAAARLAKAARAANPHRGQRVAWPSFSWPKLTLTLARLRRNVAL